MKKANLLICITLLSQFLFAQWEIRTSGQYPDIQAIDFPANEIGYACGDGFILKTTDGGETWNKINTEYDFKSIDFPTVLTGYAAGRDSTICKTTDGGLTWSKLKTPHLTNTFLDYNSIAFLNENIGFIAAGGYETDEFFETWISYGFIMKTVNGGETWDYLNTWTGMESIFIIEGTTTVYSAGGISSPWGLENALFKSVDMGVNWEQIEGDIENPFRSINCFDEKHIVINGHWSIYISSDSSNSFDYYNFDTLQSLYHHINDCYLISPTECYFIGENSSIYHQSSKDKTFERIVVEGVNSNLLAFNLTENKVGYIVGSNGLILRNKSITSAVKQDINKFSVSLYPNPTISQINLELPEYSEYELKIFNQQQLILSSKVIGNKIALNIEHLTSGFYIVEIKSKEEKWVKKFIKI